MPKGNFESLFSFYLAEFQISAMGCSAFVVEGGIALKPKVILFNSFTMKRKKTNS